MWSLKIEIASSINIQMTVAILCTLFKYIDYLTVVYTIFSGKPKIRHFQATGFPAITDQDHTIYIVQLRSFEVI
jgi:hypothetical protein